MGWSNWWCKIYFFWGGGGLFFQEKTYTYFEVTSLCLGSLTWLQRIKVALGFARALEFLHDPKKPYLVRNINAAYIILDQVQ